MILRTVTKITKKDIMGVAIAALPHLFATWEALRAPA